MVIQDILLKFNKIYKISLQECEHAISSDVLNPYHLEGDVYTHTLLVANASLKKDPNNIYRFLVALLHDIGKPESKWYKNNKVYFLGHAGISTYKSISFLLDLYYDNYITLEDIIRILYTINYHSFLYTKLQKYEEYFKYNKNILKNIIEFSYYDRAGSICLTSSAFNYNDLYKFINTSSYVKPNLDLSNPIIYILIGLPLSGKTTYISQYFSDLSIISRDNILLQYGKEKYQINSYTEIWDKLTETDQKTIDKLVQKQFKTYTTMNKNIIIDMTNMSIKTRKKWYKKQYNYKIIVFLTDYINFITSRNSLRQDKHIPAIQLLKFMKKFEMPLFSEFNGQIIDITYILNNTISITYSWEEKYDN